MAAMQLLVRRHHTVGARHFQRLTPLLAMALVIALGASACADDSPTGLAGIVRTPAPDVSAVVLPDVANGGSEFAAAATPGNLLLVYFGYTTCPDICPATLAQLRTAAQKLGDVGERIDVAMVTIDPDRDVPEKLTAYLHSFFAEGHALRTEDAASLAEAAEAFGASYEVTTGESGEVEVAHSAFLYAVDSSGRILVQWPFGTTTPDLENDLGYLFDQGV